MSANATEASTKYQSCRLATLTLAETLKSKAAKAGETTLASAVAEWLDHARVHFDSEHAALAMRKISDEINADGTIERLKRHGFADDAFRFLSLSMATLFALNDIDRLAKPS